MNVQVINVILAVIKKSAKSHIELNEKETNYSKWLKYNDVNASPAIQKVALFMT